MPNTDRALIVCEAKETRGQLVASVAACGVTPVCCATLHEAEILMRQETYRLIFCTEVLADGNFHSILRKARDLNSVAPVLVLSPCQAWDSYLSALGAGVFDFIICPANAAEMERVIGLALAHTVDAFNQSHSADQGLDEHVC